MPASKRAGSVDMQINAAVGKDTADARWRSVPLAARAHMAQLQRTVDSLTARNHELQTLADELQTLADAAWTERFKDARDYKVHLLQRAHRLATRKYLRSWSDQDGGATHAASPASTRRGPSAATIHSLGRDLLEQIFARVVGQPPEEEDTNAQPRARTTVYQPKLDGRWLARRRLAAVCRLWEALTHGACDASQHAVGPDRHAAAAAPPRGLATRELEMAVLSTRLTRLSLYAPRFNGGADASADLHFMTVATAALPQCPALAQLSIYVYDYSYSSPSLAPLFDAVAACRGLTALHLNTYSPTADSGLARFTPCSQTAASIRDAIAASTRLQQLHVTGYELCGSDVMTAVERHPVLRQLTLTNVRADGGWLRLIEAPSLTMLAISDCQHWRAGGVVTLGGTRMKALRLEQSSLDKDDLRALAQTLPLLRGVTRLELDLPRASGGDDAPSCTLAFAEAIPRMPALLLLVLNSANGSGCDLEVFGCLPRCPQLDTVQVCLPRCTYAPRSWVVALASALAACRTLRVLEVFDDLGSGELEHLFEPLAACGGLQLMCLSGSPSLRALCALGLQLPRFAALTRLTIAHSTAMDELAADVVNNLAAQAPGVALELVHFSSADAPYFYFLLPASEDVR